MQLASAVDWAMKTASRAAFRAALGTQLPGTPAPGAGTGQDPVVLVNGFTVHPESLQLLARALRRDGFRVFVPELPNNAMDRIEDTAKYLAAYVEWVRRETGAPRVDLVGYSEGGLVNRAYAKWFGGAGVVDSSITLGTPHSGVTFRGLGQIIEGVGLLRGIVPEAAQDMIPGSDFLLRLHAGAPPSSEGVRYTAIYSLGFDGIVWPAASGAMEGARNIALKRERWWPLGTGPHHIRMPGSTETYEAIRGALLAAA